MSEGIECMYYHSHKLPKLTSQQACVQVCDNGQDSGGLE